MRCAKIIEVLKTGCFRMPAPARKPSLGRGNASRLFPVDLRMLRDIRQIRRIFFPDSGKESKDST